MIGKEGDIIFMVEKSKQIRKMFSNISENYDFLNHFLSLGQDILWRKAVARKLKEKKLLKVADIACGTGDLAIEINRSICNEVVGIDFCFEMLGIAHRKLSNDQIFLVNGDGTMLPVKSEIFDAVTIAFGIRNIPERILALKEFHRVLSEKGLLLILEFDIPDNFLFKYYFRKILPFIGGIFSSKEAYTYLPESVEKFPRVNDFSNEIKSAGFGDIKITSLSFGMVKLYEAKKI